MLPYAIWARATMAGIGGARLDSSRAALHHFGDRQGCRGACSPVRSTASGLGRDLMRGDCTRSRRSHLKKRTFELLAQHPKRRRLREWNREERIARDRTGSHTGPRGREIAEKRDCVLRRAAPGIDARQLERALVPHERIVGASNHPERALARRPSAVAVSRERMPKGGKHFEVTRVPPSARLALDERQH